jgi:hypothetical protein
VIRVCIGIEHAIGGMKRSHYWTLGKSLRVIKPVRAKKISSGQPFAFSGAAQAIGFIMSDSLRK